MADWTRKVNILVLSGLWCGDCVAQCPLLAIIADNRPDLVSLRFLDRDKHADLAEQVKAGAEKIITKNGESYVALIDADRLDYYHRLERERIHLLLINDAKRGLADIEAGRTFGADAALAQIQKRRASVITATAANKRG